MTPKQAEVMDALFNGGYLWRAGKVHFLARASHKATSVYYQSERINAKTFNALMATGLLEKVGENRWFALR